MTSSAYQFAVKALAYLPHLSPALVWQRCSRPAMIPVWMGAPPSSDVRDVVTALFPNLDPKIVHDLHKQLLLNNRFFQAVNERYAPVRERRFNHDGLPELLYLLVRARMPRVVVETGVFDGASTCAILQALHDNGHGECVSIDLPAVDAIPGSTDRMGTTTLPPGRQPGWMIPEYLRSRHTLALGDSQALLPAILHDHDPIDVFFHDSLHTFAHQMFEYAAAWEHLSDGGLMLSDDIFWSPAFHQFCRAKRQPYLRVGQFGAARKPAAAAVGVRH
jgi:predicted O-methyltransferase YrrM